MLSEIGHRNTYVGFSAGGSHNAGFGQIGDENTAVDACAGFETDGSHNVFLGHYVAYRYNGSDKMAIEAGAGNVRIGTGTPQAYKLYVQGTANATGG